MCYNLCIDLTFPFALFAFSILYLPQVDAPSMLDFAVPREHNQAHTNQARTAEGGQR
jgi:hypothetical protein